MNEKLREAKEAKYREANLDVRSVCSGQFYKKNDKTYEQCKNCANCFKYKQYSKKTEDTPEVHFHYIDNFRKCDLHKYKPIDGAYLVLLTTYNILYTNDLAVGASLDLKEFVKDCDKETARLIKVLLKRTKRYEYMVNDILSKNIMFFRDFNSLMDDTISPIAKRMKFAIIKALKENGEKDYKMLGYIEYARTMIGYASVSVSKKIKECLKIKKESLDLHFYRLDRKYSEDFNYDMLSIVEALSKWATRNCNRFNLNSNEEIMNAYTELDCALNNIKLVSETLTAVQKNYD